MSHPGVLGCGLLMLALLGGAAQAEHEADHRYSIRGYVLDAAEKPVVGERVSAKVAGKSGSTRTDEDGFYTLNLHLHDAHIGSDIELRAGDSIARMRMQAERGDQYEERVHWASFVAGQFREDALGRFQMPGWAWALMGFGGLVAVVAVAARVQRVMARRRRSAEAANNPTQSAAKRRKGKKRRR